MVAVAAIIAGVSAVYGAVSSSSQNASQASWNRYNSQVAYNNEMDNIQSQQLLASMNAAFGMSIANKNAQNITDTANLNASLIASTTAYNNDLLEQDMAFMWEAAELDIRNMETQRAKERGSILAAQSTSGTTMDEGSNFDIIVDQKTQEAMDAFIVRHGADIEASKITNKIAQNQWEGDVAIQKTLWEGEWGAYTTMSNATMNAMSGLMTAQLSGDATKRSADLSLTSGMAGANNTEAANNSKITGSLINGLFSAASKNITPQTVPDDLGYELQTSTGTQYAIDYRPNYSPPSNGEGSSLAVA